MGFALYTFGPSEGTPCLWLHGFMGCGMDGKGLADGLDGGHRMICPDLPGHGATSLSGWDWENTLEEIARLAKGCRWAGGYSMGGRLLMAAAARHPDAFAALVVESASLGYEREEDRLSRRKTDADRAEALRTLGLEEFCRDWYRLPMWGGLEAPERRGDPEELAEALERFGSGRQPDLRPWLRSASCPVLWLAGRRDVAYVSQADWVRRHTSCEVETPDAGHNIHRQRPDAWAAAVRRFEHKLPTGKESD